MARAFIVWCDFCLEQSDAHVEGEELPEIIIGAAKPRRLAACATHQADWWNPMVETIKRIGVIVDGSPAPTDGQAGLRVPCPICSRALKNEASLSGHMRTMHGTTLKAYREATGGSPGGQQAELALGDGQTPSNAPTALPGQYPRATKEPAIKRAECKECPPGQTVYEWPKNARPTQALGVHRNLKHGIPAKSKAELKREKAANG